MSNSNTLLNQLEIVINSEAKTEVTIIVTVVTTCDYGYDLSLKPLISNNVFAIKGIHFGTNVVISVHRCIENYYLDYRLQKTSGFYADIVLSPSLTVVNIQSSSSQLPVNSLAFLSAEVPESANDLTAMGSVSLNR